MSFQIGTGKIGNLRDCKEHNYRSIICFIFLKIKKGWGIIINSRFKKEKCTAMRLKSYMTLEFILKWLSWNYFPNNFRTYSIVIDFQN